MHILGKMLIFCSLPVFLFAQNTFIQEMVNATNRDSLQSSVMKLQSFGTRYEYSPGQDSAGSFILREFNRLGIQAAADPYTFGGWAFLDAALVSRDSIWLVGNTNIILFSSNGGSTWISQYSPATATFYGIDFANNQIGVSVGSQGTISRTTNAGSSWISISSPRIAILYSVSYADVSTCLIVGSSGTILRSTTGGGSWTTISSGTIRPLRDIKCMTPSMAIAVGDSGYILKSTDAGATWQKKPSGTTSYLYSVNFLTAQTGFASGNGSTILKTTDGGETWNKISFAYPSAGVLRGIFFSDSQNGLVIENSAKILRTTNGGQTWQIVDSLISGGWGPTFYKLRGISGQRILTAGSRSLVYTSTTGGASWTTYTATLPSMCFHASQNIVATIPGTVTPLQECVMVAHYDSYSNPNPMVTAPGANDNATGTAAIMEAVRLMRNYRFKSTVKLVAVSAEEFGMYGSEHYAYTAKKEGRTIIAAINGDMLGYPMKGDTLHIAVGTFLNRNRLLDSALIYNQRYNIGLNLVEVIDSTGASDYGPFALAGYDALDVAEGTANEIWGGADPFYHTPNDSATKLHFGLVSRAAQLMLASVAELAGATGRVSDVSEPAHQAPTQFALYQNYPNPFNPATVIQYSVAKSSVVNLKIFDLLGREVATLVSEEQTPGSRKVQWNATNFASGMYLVRMSTNYFTDTKKILLMK